LKQRLIGAAVLLALGVIFIPMILDGSGNPVLGEIPAIPRPLDAVDPQALVIPTEPPVREHVPMVVQKPATDAPASKPEAGPVVAQQKPAAQKQQAKAPQAVTPQTKKPAKKPVKKPSPTLATAASPEKIRAWTVQVGSFNTSDKALKLRSKLRAKGYKAYVDKIRKQNKTYYRVRVGPVLNRRDADKSLKKLKKAGQINAYVVRHP